MSLNAPTGKWTTALQSPDRVSVLEEVLSDMVSYTIIDKPTNKQIDTKYKKLLSDTLMDTFGLLVNVEIADGNNIAVLPPYIDKRHSLMSFDPETVDPKSELMKILRTNGKRLAESEGTLNLDTLRAGGSYSKLESTLYLDIAGYVKFFSLTGRELTALVLHETGHIFETLLNMHRVNRVNGVLNEILVESHGNNNPGKVLRYKLQQATAAGIIHKDDMDSLDDYDGTDVMVLGGIMSKMFGNAATFEAAPHNTHTTFERNSDRFVSKLGYGLELVRSINRLQVRSKGSHFSYTYDQPSSRPWGAFKVIMSYVAYIALIVGISSGSSVVILTTFVFTSITFIVLSAGSLYDRINIVTTDLTYDTDVLRLEKLLQNEIAQLRMTYKTHPKVAAKQIKNIDEMRKIISTRFESRSLLGALMDRVKPSSRRVKSSLDQKDALERILDNPLLLESLRITLGELRHD